MARKSSSSTRRRRHRVRMQHPMTSLHAIVADVSLARDASAYVSEAVSRFGKIDVLFCNAGNFGTVAPIQDYPEDVFDAVQAVHVKGAFLACKYAVPNMNDGGSIVINSSVAATRGDAGVYAYITAKHAQIGLMRCLAKELAPRRIRANTIHPGPIDNAFQSAVEDGLSKAIGRSGSDFFNELIPLGRHGTPDGDRQFGALSRIRHEQLHDGRVADGRRRNERVRRRHVQSGFVRTAGQAPCLNVRTATPRIPATKAAHPCKDARSLPAPPCSPGCGRSASTMSSAIPARTFHRSSRAWPKRRPAMCRCPKQSSSRMNMPRSAWRTAIISRPARRRR